MSIINKDLLYEIADGYREAYNLPDDEKEMQAHRLIAEHSDFLSPEFLDWYWRVAVIENIVEDVDGWMPDEWYDGGEELSRFLGREAGNMLYKPATLVYARLQMLLAYMRIFPIPGIQQSEQEMVGDSEKIAGGEVAGDELWEIIEKYGDAEQAMLASIVAELG